MLDGITAWLNRISGTTQLAAVDWAMIFGFFAVSLIVGVGVSRWAGRNATTFFLSGRNMPWWLLGVSMVATTFSSDTPNLVTDITRQDGVAGNWRWWAFLLTGMLTVFVYARLWRRSGVMTDIEFYELRYSGKPAAFLRGFRAIYLGVFFNVLIMAAVTLAAIKIGGVMLGLTPLETILIAAIVTAVFSMLGGLTGVILTDFLLFALAMTGSVAAAVVAVQHPEVGGLGGMLTHDAVRSKLSLLPDFGDTELLLSVFIIPLAVQWWSVWYPGSEPGGGGYVAQRMLAARNESHATGATLLFNVAHYALRPWPWIIVALSSLIVFPTLDSLQAAFPHVDPGVLRDDMAYPAMLTFLPSGLLGLVLASLAAAYMSTISTHLNWGSSYVVNDVYRRFCRPSADERELVLAGRVSTLVLIIFGSGLALLLSHALEAFHILLQVGAGTGLLFILRWFWWRINAYSELAAMVGSFLVAVYFQFLHARVFPQWADLAGEWRIVIGVGLTTIIWMLVTLLTPPAEEAVLRRFLKLTRAGGPGWKAVVARARADGELLEEGVAEWNVPAGILCMVIGSVAVYSSLFATGYWIYGNRLPAVVLTAVAVASMGALARAWKGCRG